MTFMKKIVLTSILTIVACCCFCIASFSQLKQIPIDKSPMDMSYYPFNYPILKIQDKATEPLVARVTFGRPQKNGRTIFGDLVEYGQVWRLGANEATEIEFFKDVKIGNAKVKKGRYTLYCIPTTDKWTMILNKDTDIWGAFKYDPKKDLLRTDIPVAKTTDISDSFTMYFDKITGGANLVMTWDDVIAKLPILF